MDDPDFSVANDRVNRLLEAIRYRQLKSGGLAPIDDLITDNPKLAYRLRLIARGREITDEDAILVQREMDAELVREMVARMEQQNRCYENCENLVLFQVENKGRNRIDVLAADSTCAKVLARLAGHVQTEANARVFRYRQTYLDDIRKKSPALWRAIKGGIPGVVTKVGNHVIVRNKTEVVYSPLSAIDEA